MLRIEIIPYKSLDEQYKLSLIFAKQRHKKEFKTITDLGNCFYIEHFKIDKNIRM